ncbi:Na(+)/H(+) antiporter NhaA 2 [Rhodococcoides trifolii]|uniref:Na(+)/H(+) antiporter NhaA n=1 Tax=Rhodococcoides trifolii TaxID=908250 RepID=A0A917CMY4_9NOCA|nr:Na+/H+ antiporter NhaA [Rhodococcus trifolii]GGF92964.1 Na(+)/H(+) antiporter NhaA 2 [Rhodococcus trifolii]
MADPITLRSERPRSQRLRSLVDRVAAARREDNGTLSAVFLLVATVVALVWANSPWGATYTSFWHTPLSIQIGSRGIELDLQHWVNDGLMALFFFVVGLEVKREFAMGELRDRSRAAIPIVAAIAGLALPAALYLVLNPSGEAASAWGVVISTDTAFLLGTLAIIGPERAVRLRIFLLTLAVADDVGALAIIAFFYTEDLSVTPLIVSLVGLALIASLRQLKVWRGAGYGVVSLVTWVAMYFSGVHPTLAGVMIALILPVYPPRRREVERASDLARAFRQSPSPEYARAARLGMEQAVSVNERLMRLYQPYTAFIIVPIFALANAGVVLSSDTLRAAATSPITWGIVLGLVGGKFIGITGATVAFARARRGSLTPGLTIPQVAGGAALSGVGFTISLFIVDLALPNQALADEARVGVLLASVLAVVLGAIVFRVGNRFSPPPAEPPTTLLRRVDPKRDHIRGRVDAPLTIVEYGDFECPFCSKATGSTREVQAHFGGEVRYVFRHFPLDDYHPHARHAAQASEAAAAQGKFWEMHDTLFLHSDALEPDDIDGYAAELGLDLERFEEDIRTGDFATRVLDDDLDALTSELPGTPTFYLGVAGSKPKRHNGPHDAATIIRELEALRAGRPEAGRESDGRPEAGRELDGRPEAGRESDA